jgi:hypothetical protein
MATNNAINLKGPTPSLMYTNLTTQSSVTGDGTIYEVQFTNKIYDVTSSFDGTSTFTTPLAGNYNFSINIYLDGITTAMTNALVYLTTTQATYRFMQENFAPGQAVGGSYVISYAQVCPMAVGDTAILYLRVLNGTKVVSIDGSTAAGFRTPIFECHYIPEI